MIDYFARKFCEHLQQGFWLGLLDEHFKEIGDRLMFDEWCFDGNSVFNNSRIQFKLPQLDTRIRAVGFYKNEFDHKPCFDILVDNPVELDCDYTYAAFYPGDLKFMVS